MEDLMRIGLSNALGAAALATAVAGLALIFARRPAVVHCLWVVVLLKLVTPPLFEVPVALPAAEEPTVVRITLDETPAALDGADWEAADEPDFDFEGLEVDVADEGDETRPEDACPPVLAAAAAPAGPSWGELARTGLGGAWLAGSIATAGLAIYRIGKFQRRLRHASPAGYRVEEEVAALSAEMGLKRPPLVDVIDARTTPMLWGLGLRPRLILPRMLWKELDARARTLLLTHELAHLKRGDHLLRFFELGVTILFWWLPVVWWVRRALRDVEEQCCDAWVVWMFPDDARAYAETLLDTVDFLNPGSEPEPLLASGFGKVQHLRKRLTMVMKGTTPRTLGWQGSLGALAMAGVLLPMSPTWAQKAEEAAVTFEAAPLADVVVVGEPADGKTVVTLSAGRVDVSGPAEAEAKPGVVTLRAVADGKGKLQTFNVVGGEPGKVVLTTVQDDEKAKADEAKAKADEDKAEAEEAKADAEEAKAEAEAAKAEAIAEAEEAKAEALAEAMEGKAEAIARSIEAQAESMAKAIEDKAEAMAKTIEATVEAKVAMIEDQAEAKEKGEGDKKEGKEKAEEAKKAKEARKAIKVEVKADGAEMGEAMKKAAEQVKAQIKELKEKGEKGEMDEVQIKALSGALQQIERMARDPKRFSVDVKPSIELRRAVNFDFKVDEPKAAEAKKQVEQLAKVMAEKQKELVEAQKKLAEAQRELAKLSGRAFTFRAMPDVNARLKEVRPMEFKPMEAPRRIFNPGEQADDAKEKARIDALEQKLDKVLKHLEGLDKKPDGDEKK